VSFPKLRARITRLASVLGVAAACATPVTYPPETPGPRPRVRAFYFGHSLVGQELPATVASFARARGRTFEAHGQLGWGTSLASHLGWDGRAKGAPLGFADDNRPPLFVGEGKGELQKGSYDTLVLTETNGFVKGDPAPTVRAATALARIARARVPDARVFVYANWLSRHEEGGNARWVDRTRADLVWWERVADGVSRELGGAPVYVIPAGVILADVVEACDGGALTGLRSDQLFRTDASAPRGIDGVHLSALGFWVLGLVHYAVLHHDTPLGLSRALREPEQRVLSENNAHAIEERVRARLVAYARAGTLTL
jgi:hypothetical protein